MKPKNMNFSLISICLFWDENTIQVIYRDMYSVGKKIKMLFSFSWTLTSISWPWWTVESKLLSDCSYNQKSKTALPLMSSIVVLSAVDPLQIGNILRLFFQNWVQSIESQQFSAAGQFVKSLLLINNSMNPLEIHCGHFRLQGSRNISYCPLQFILMLLSFTVCGRQRKWKSAKSHVIKGGSLIGLCCPGWFVKMIGCPFGNVYSNWKGHLACHRMKVRSDCQHAIWDCPS